MHHRRRQIHALPGLLMIYAASPTPTSQASTCAVAVYREWSPARPPLLPTLPPVDWTTATPWIDATVAPAGTMLSYYRVHLPDGPDPAEPAIFLVKAGASVAVHWSGVADPGACCLGAACDQRCEGDCLGAGGRFESGGSCPQACGGPVTGACCTETGCVDGLDRTTCEDISGARGVYRGSGTACSDVPDRCGVEACCELEQACGDHSVWNCVWNESMVPAGPGTRCADDPDPCNRVWGLCCYGNDLCVDHVNPVECSQLWRGRSVLATSCSDSPSPCTIGACCDGPGNCRDDAYRGECRGTFHPGQTCALISC